MKENIYKYKEVIIILSVFKIIIDNENNKNNIIECFIVYKKYI